MKAGRILIALMFIVGLVGVLGTGVAVYSRFLYISILLMAMGWLWTRWVVRGLSLERTSRESRANMGDVFEEGYKLTNKSALPAPWIEIVNQSRIAELYSTHMAYAAR
jgi:hypothetical protein